MRCGVRSVKGGVTGVRCGAGVCQGGVTGVRCGVRSVKGACHWCEIVANQPNSGAVKGGVTGVRCGVRSVKGGVRSVKGDLSLVSRCPGCQDITVSIKVVSLV